MPRISRFPILYDEVKTFCISDLKKWGYLKSNSFKSGTITWRRHGEKIGSIDIAVNMDENPFLQLSYNYRDEPVNYRIKLVSVPSNLGIGKVWYFLCPHTDKRCRKLYGAGKYFLHRDAYPNVLYEKQTYSKYGRSLDKMFTAELDIEKLYEELHGMHFKTHYAGKPTKRYLKILRKLEIAERSSVNYFKH